jgi:hypothetical protein
MSMLVFVPWYTHQIHVHAWVYEAMNRLLIEPSCKFQMTVTHIHIYMGAVLQEDFIILNGCNTTQLRQEDI